MRKSVLVLFLLLFCLAFFVPVGAAVGASGASYVMGSAGYIPDMMADQGIPAGQYSLVQCYVHDAKGNAIPGVAVYFTIDTSANPNQNKIFQSSVTDSTGRAYAHLSSPIAGSASVSAYYQLPGDNKYTVKNIAVTFFPAPKPSVTDDILNTIQTFMARMTHSSGQGARIPPINGAAPGIPRTSGSGIPNPQAGEAAPGIPRASGPGTLNPQASGAASAIPSSYYDDFAGLFTGTYAVNVNTNSTNAYRPEAPAQSSQFSPNVGVTDQGSDIVLDGYYKSVPIHLVSKVTRTLNTATCSLSFNLANKTISGAGTLTFTMGQDGTPVVNGRGEGAYSRPYTPEKGADYHPGSGTVTGARISTALPNNMGNNQDGVGPVGDIPGPDNTDQAATGIIAPGLLTLAAAAAGSLPDLPFSSGGPDASLPDGDGGDGSGDGGGGDAGDGGGDGGGGDTSSSYLDPTTEVPPVFTGTGPTDGGVPPAPETVAPPVDTSTQAPPQPTVPPDSVPTETPPAAAAPPVEPPTPSGPLDGAEKAVHDNAGNGINLVYLATPTFTDGTTGTGGWFNKDTGESFDENAFNLKQQTDAQYAAADAVDAAKQATGADLKQKLDAIKKEQQDKLAQEKYLDNLGDKAMTSTTLTDDNKQKVWDAIQQQQSNIEDGLSVDSSKLKAITSLVKDAYSGKTADESTLPAAYDGMSTLNVIKDTASNITNDAVQGTTDAAHAILTGKDRDGNISVMGIVARTGIDALTAGQAEWVMTPAGSLWKMSDQVWNAKPGVDESTFKIATREMGMVVLGQQVTWGLQSAGNQIGSSFVNNFPNAANNIVANVNPIAGQFAQSFTTKLGKAVIVEGIKKMFPK
jgi:hypothetical protein